MKPSLTFLVCSPNGDAAALAEVGRDRAAALGLPATIVPLATQTASGRAIGPESVTAIVPVEFTGAQHQAWCLLCQLSLLRCGVGFTVLVLGAAGSAEFQARQRALLSTTPGSPRRRRHAA